MDRWFTMLGLLTLFPACGGSGRQTSDGSGGADPAAESACKDIYATLVARLDACDGQPMDIGVAMTDPQIMQSDLDAQCHQAALDVHLGLAVLDESKLAACKADIQALGCYSLLSGIGSFPPPSCNLVLVGKAPTGGACHSSFECGPGDACDESQGCPGQCVGAIIGGGMFCGPSMQECTNEQYCDETSMQCAPPKTSGSCNASFECAAGYFCQGLQTMQAPTSCVAYRRLGDACTAGDNVCAPGAFCDGGKCAEWPRAGGACGDVGGEQVGCVESKCSAKYSVSGYTEAGTCVARLSVGSPCSTADTDWANPCIAGATCQGGRCTASACF